MRIRYLLILLCLLLKAPGFAQTEASPGNTLLGKTNALLWAATVPNIGVEYIINNRYSIDLPLIYCPYSVKRNFTLKCMMVQPEFRYWLDAPLRGHFVGAHVHAGYFNVATNHRSRYQDGGTSEPLLGVGLSYGYCFALSPRWNLQLNAGVGYANIRYNAFYNLPHGAQYDAGTKNYWGITRLGVSFTYHIKQWRAR